MANLDEVCVISGPIREADDQFTLDVSACTHRVLSDDGSRYLCTNLVTLQFMTTQRGQCGEIPLWKSDSGCTPAINYDLRRLNTLGK